MLDAKKNKGQPQPYLRNPNVRWFAVDLSDVRLMPFEEHESARFGLRQGDVVICEGGEAGRAAIWDGQIPNMKFQKAIHRVRCGPRLSNRFLVHRLWADYLDGHIADYYTGATIKHLTGQDLARYRIALPPITEQRRIAAILDKADELRAKRRAAIAKLDTLAQSIFLEMFGDPATNPMGWPVHTLGDPGIGRLDRGVSKHRPRNAPELLGGQHPLIQTGDIANSDGYIRRYSTSYSDFGLSQSKLWPAGTLCITIAANIGKTAVLTFPACFPDSVVGFVAAAPAATEFVRIWMSFRQGELERAAPESAQKNINLKTLRELCIPFPPENMRIDFTQRIRALASLRAQQRQSLRASEALVDSLQHRAFRGEL